MSHRKRTRTEYEKEIIDAANRMRKRKEYHSSARNSNTWYNFLDRIGVDLSLGSRKDFFDNVRDKILEFEKPVITPAQVQALAKRGISVEFNKVYRNAKGQFTKEPTGISVPIYRDIHGRFVSPKNV